MLIGVDRSLIEYVTGGFTAPTHPWSGIESPIAPLRAPDCDLTIYTEFAMS